MFELKRLSEDAIPAALEKALRYRLLNEPAEAESICHDVLQIDPENQQALVVLLLALTDRFGNGYTVSILYCPVSAIPTFFLMGRKGPSNQVSSPFGLPDDSEKDCEG